MQRLLAVLLILIGLIGLLAGRLGETVWAPATETTATAQLSDPGPAVVIDPGVLYVGGMEGEVEITGASEVSVITAANDDIDAYLSDTRHTRVTGASDWSTLSTEEVDADGETELSSPESSDLWRTVDTGPTPYTLDIADFAAGEHGDNEQVYRAILIVADGTEPGAESISITWPVEAENEWVPYAYAGGAAIAVIGLVLFVVSIGSGRRRDERDAQEDPLESGGETGAGTDPDDGAVPFPAAPTAVTGAGTLQGTDATDVLPAAGELGTDVVPPIDPEGHDQPDEADARGDAHETDAAEDAQEPSDAEGAEGPDDGDDAGGAGPVAAVDASGETGTGAEHREGSEDVTEVLEPIDDDDQSADDPTEEPR